MDRRLESIKKIDDDGHVFWEAWTKPGWCWWSPGLHVLHEDTRKEILAQRWQLKKCGCPECNKQYTQETKRVAL
jgi:hypothetical protein